MWYSAMTIVSYAAKRCCSPMPIDLDRAAALKTVHGYLDDIGIAYCGRYGDWGYMWTDESFKSGELAAEKALSKHSVPSALVS